MNHNNESNEHRDIFNQPTNLCVYHLLDRCTIENCELTHINKIDHCQFFYLLTHNALNGHLQYSQFKQFSINGTRYSFDAMKICLENCKKGDSSAMHIVGMYYEFIDGNRDLAVDYYLKSIENGNSDSICKLGRLYFESGNSELACNYYSIAIEKNNITAYHLFGKYYDSIEKTYNIQNEHGTSFEYYSIGMQKGCCLAMNDLADYHYYTKPNNQEALKSYLLSASNGSNYAMNKIGVMYFNIEKNYDEARKYFLMAINNHSCQDMSSYNNYYYNVVNGSVEAMCNIGKFYHLIEKNYEKAIECYSMAIDNNNYRAMGASWQLL